MNLDTARRRIDILWYVDKTYGLDTTWEELDLAINRACVKLDCIRNGVHIRHPAFLAAVQELITYGSQMVNGVLVAI